jgi:transcriptional regulator with XRE-family HTH domain
MTHNPINIDPEMLWNLALELEDESDPCVGVESQAFFSKTQKSPAEIEKESQLRKAFSAFMRQLRLLSRLSTAELSKRTKIKEEHIKLIEEDASYRPSPRTLVLLSEFYKIPANVILQMVGALRNIDDKIGLRMVQFAAMSKQMNELSEAEKKELHEFIALLRDYHERTRR